MNVKTVVVAKSRRMIVVRLGFLVALLPAWAAQAQTTAFNFQGRLSNLGLPVNGHHDLRFSVYGSQAGADLISGPITVSSVAVRGGIFHCRLDFGEQVFNGSARWLDISVRPTGTATYTNLSPRVELTSAPYAVRAKEAAVAANVAAGSAVKSVNNLKDNVNLAAGPNVTLTTNGNTLTIGATGGGGGGVWSTVGTNTYYNTGNVGIGTTTPNSRLDVRGFLTLDSGANAALFTGTGGSELNRYLNLFNSPGLASASGLKAGGVLVSDSYFYANPGKNDLIVKGRIGIGTPTPTAPLTVQSASGAYGFEHTDGDVSVGSYVSATGGWLGTRTDDALHFFVNDGLAGMTLSLANNVGIGTTTPTSRLDIVGAQDAVKITGSQPFMTLRDTSSGNARGIIQSVGGGLNFFSEQYLNGSSPSGFMRLHGTGNVGVGTATPATRLDVAGDITGTRLVLRADPATPANVTLLCANAGVTTFVPFNSANNLPLNLIVRDATVRQLTITGGADLAEPFQMSHDGIAKGSVVVIDEDNPGHLKLSTKAYDKQVAGIVSGANGVRPGISLHQEGLLEGGQNVALSGRVYVHADASFGAIKPGDLLTTSDTPGHAMRVADHAQAHGAILGKAMTALELGKGMVLVLVTLQ